MALPRGLIELFCKEALFQRGVIVLHVRGQSLSQWTIPDVIEYSMLERMVENRILFLIIVDLRDGVRDERIVRLLPGRAEHI